MEVNKGRQRNKQCLYTQQEKTKENKNNLWEKVHPEHDFVFDNFPFWSWSMLETFNLSEVDVWIKSQKHLQKHIINEANTPMGSL